MSYLLLTFAALCVGVMGFAIQRGATCTVAAMDEVVNKRSVNRLRSLFEASLWVAGGLLLAQMLHLLAKTPSGYALSGWTVAGGALLGLGALINGACVFGAIARFGSGEWAYALTPFGFYVGAASVGALFAPAPAEKLAPGSVVLDAPAWAALVFVGFVSWRLLRPWWRERGAQRPGTLLERVRRLAAERVWAPHAATIVIGVTFLFTWLIAGAWAYTDLLAELARGMASNLPVRVMLLAALLAGAVLGGWTAGRFRPTRIGAIQLLRCIVGGALMGWGSLLIPGSNDGLILVGLPLLWPYAWVAFLTMCLTIGTAQIGLRWLRMPMAEQGASRRSG